MLRLHSCRISNVCSPGPLLQTRQARMVLRPNRGEGARGCYAMLCAVMGVATPRTLQRLTHANAGTGFNTITGRQHEGYMSSLRKNLHPKPPTYHTHGCDRRGPADVFNTSKASLHKTTPKMLSQNCTFTAIWPEMLHLDERFRWTMSPRMPKMYSNSCVVSRKYMYLAGPCHEDIDMPTVGQFGEAFLQHFFEIKILRCPEARNPTP